MTAAGLPTAATLGAVVEKKFRPFLLGAAGRAGWQPCDFPGIAFVAAADALAGFDPARGDLVARAFSFLRRAAARSGFLPAGDDAEEALLGVAGGDDPAAVVEAIEEVGRLVALGAAVERPRGSDRTARRHTVKRRGAAERFLRGGDGRQGELF
jgi:hypothetical protein